MSWSIIFGIQPIPPYTFSVTAGLLGISGAAPLVQATATGEIRASTGASQLVGQQPSLFIQSQTTAGIGTAELSFQINSGSPRGYDDPTILRVCRYASHIVYGIWDGWQQGNDGGNTPRLQTMAQICTTLKNSSLNPIGTIGCVYNIINNSDNFEQSWGSLMSNNHWRLYSSYPNGSQVTWNGFHLYNPTRGGPTATIAGHSYTGQQWIISYQFDYIVNADQLGLAVGVNAPNADLGGLWNDNFVFVTPVSADWNRTGSSQGAGESTSSANMRQGWQDCHAYWRAARPGILLYGNFGTEFTTGQPTSPLTTLPNGGLLEGSIGASYGIETWGGTIALMDEIARARAYCVPGPAGQRVIIQVHHAGLTDDGRDYYTQSPTRQARKYGWVLAFVAGGVPTPDSVGAGNPPENSYQHVINPNYICRPAFWFDYQSIDPANGHCLTYAQMDARSPALPNAQNFIDVWDDPPRPLGGAAWKQGVFRRRGHNSITGARFELYLNPKGNGSQTFTLDSSMYHVTGTQDTGIDNGALVSSLTLPDRSGIVMWHP